MGTSQNFITISLEEDPGKFPDYLISYDYDKTIYFINKQALLILVNMSIKSIKRQFGCKSNNACTLMK